MINYCVRGRQRWCCEEHILGHMTTSCDTVGSHGEPKGSVQAINSYSYRVLIQDNIRMYMTTEEYVQQLIRPRVLGHNEFHRWEYTAYVDVGVCEVGLHTPYARHYVHAQFTSEAIVVGNSFPRWATWLLQQKQFSCRRITGKIARLASGRDILMSQL